MIKMKLKTVEMVLLALCTALVAVLSQISFPILPGGVPLTMQTLAIAFCGYFLGAKGVLAVLTYLLIGVVGAPVFAGFQGGFGVIAGPTGGFLWGFLFMTLCCGLGRGKKIWQALLLGAAGIFLCHLLGIAQFRLVSGRGWTDSFLLVSAPYIIKDFASAAAALWCARMLKKRGIPAQ